jgi:hypothetical protein
MSEALVYLCLPRHLGVGLLLGYAFMVFAAARLTETLARLHFERGRRLAEHGFHYDADEDHYHCHQGERLSLHLVDEEKQVAVYRASASRCGTCPHKADCTPHHEGRHIYRPLAAWAETDVGRFHQWLALVMVASGAAISLAGFILWAGQRGCGLLAFAFLLGITLVARDTRWIWDSSSQPDLKDAP